MTPGIHIQKGSAIRHTVADARSLEIGSYCNIPGQRDSVIGHEWFPSSMLGPHERFNEMRV